MVLSNLEKMKIITEYNTGKSMSNIAEEMKINIKTVNKWITRYSETNSLMRKRGSGKYKKVEFNINN